MVTLILGLSALLGQSVPPPPVIPQQDPHIAEERRKIVAGLQLSAARIFVARRTEHGHELILRFVELRGRDREDFLTLLRSDDTFYDMPGVIGCIGDEYKIVLLWPERRADAWFSSRCQRIMGTPGGPIAFDTALSERGAEALRRLFARSIRREKPVD